MTNPLIRKLENFAKLSGEDKRALETVCQQVRRYGAREDIIQHGDRTDGVKVVLEGWVSRYKHLEDGRRQIMAYLVPGDFCDLRVFVLRRMDHSVGTLTPATVAVMQPDAVRDLTFRFPRLTQALWWSTLVEEAISREWLVNVGQRSAYERMAHLFCEVYLRLQAVGLAGRNTCEWPLTQTEMGDTTGLSTVHVNRTLQELRGDNLISLRGKTLTILNLERLQDAALFSPDYLHLDHEGAGLSANDRERS